MNARFLTVERFFGFDQIFRSGQIDPFVAFLGVIFARRCQQRGFQIGIVRIEAAHPHTLIQFDNRFDQRFVNDFAIPFVDNESQQCLRRFWFEFVVHVRPETTQSGLCQGWETVMFDIIPVQICEEFFQPFVHNLMIDPPMMQFGQEQGRTILIPQRRYNVGRQVPFNGFPMALVQFSRPIVRRSLRAHVVTCPVRLRRWGRGGEEGVVVFIRCKQRVENLCGQTLRGLPRFKNYKTPQNKKATL